MEQFKIKYIQIKSESHIPIHLVLALVCFLCGNEHFCLLTLNMVDVLPNPGHDAFFEVFQSLKHVKFVQLNIQDIGDICSEQLFLKNMWNYAFVLLALAVCIIKARKAKGLF